MKLPSVLRIPAVATAALILTACGTVKEYWPAKGADYKESRQEPSLELPPDLRSSEIEDSLVIPSATLSEYETDARTRAPSSEAGVLPQPENIEVRQDGRQRWLVVQAPPEQVWPRVRDFWVQSGFLLTVEDPRVGILETEWAENRADIPQGPIRRTLGKVMDFAYSAATRDKFRVRLERGSEPGVTEVYVTHQGVEEVVEGTPEDENTVWKPRPSDPALEAEMLQRLMVFMGVEQERAKQRMAQQSQETPAVRAELIHTNMGEVELHLTDDFSRAWRRTGLALDRVGFTVEDRNRSEGIYYVRYNDPLKQQESKGLLSRLAFWNDDEPIDREAQYRIRLEASGAQTIVIVRDMDGKRDNSKTASRILTLLEEQLK